jgi:hypothetical protein
MNALFLQGAFVVAARSRQVTLCKRLFLSGVCLPAQATNRITHAEAM